MLVFDFLGIHLGIHGIGIFTYAYKALIISSVDVPLDSHEKSWTPKLFFGAPVIWSGRIIRVSQPKMSLKKKKNIP